MNQLCKKDEDYISNHDFTSAATSYEISGSIGKGYDYIFASYLFTQCYIV